MAKSKIASEPSAYQQAEARLAGLYVKAADTLAELLDADDPAVRLKAAAMILKAASLLE